MSTVVTYSTRSIAASFKADPEIWSNFKTTCKTLGVDICCVLETLMLAWMEGQKATATVIKPVTVNVTLNHVVERLRRKPVIEPCNPNPYLCEQKCARAFERQFKGGE